jgi:flagellar protein FlaG
MLQRIDGPTLPTAAAVAGVGASMPPQDAPSAPAAPAASQPSQPTADQVRQAVADANRNIQAFTQALEFEVDHDTHEVVVKLVDTQDGSVLRQVPSQEMLAIARALDRMQTLLLRGQA